MQEKCGLKLLAAQVSVLLYAVLRFAAGALAMFNATCLHHHQDICHAVTFRAFVVVYDLETARRIIQFLIGQDLFFFHDTPPLNITLTNNMSQTNQSLQYTCNRMRMLPFIRSGRQVFL